MVITLILPWSPPEAPKKSREKDPQRFKVKVEESDESDSEWKQMQGVEKKAKKKSRLKRLGGQGWCQRWWG